MLRSWIPGIIPIAQDGVATQSPLKIVMKRSREEGDNDHPLDQVVAPPTDPNWRKTAKKHKKHKRSMSKSLASSSAVFTGTGLGPLLHCIINGQKHTCLSGWRYTQGYPQNCSPSLMIAEIYMSTYPFHGHVSDHWVSVTSTWCHEQMCLISL